MKYKILFIIPFQCFASWSGQWHAANWYDHFIPMETINTSYNGYYPYWGFGLGLGRTLDLLAQQQEWSQISHMLKQEKNIIQTNPVQDRMNTLRLKRIDLHLDGIN